MADTLLHKVTPALFVLDWLLFVPKVELRWTTARDLLVFPIFYGAWTLIHAPFSGFYPYPFVEVPKLGLAQVLINLFALVILLSVTGFLFVALGRRIDRRVVPVRLPSHPPAPPAARPAPRSSRTG